MQIPILSSRFVGLVGVAMAAATPWNGSAWAANGTFGQNGDFSRAPSEEVTASDNLDASDDASDSALLCRPFPFSGNRSTRKKPTATPILGSFSAPCVSINDGDTLVVKYNGGRVTIDLNAIDAPELSQEFGIEAKLALSNVILGHNLRIYPTKRDASGKLHAWVLKGTTEINRLQVQSGFAWWSSGQAPSETEISALQNKARAARLGLWRGAAPTSPWAWRKRQQATKRLLSV
ncbi:MAG TPA: thermonuclease family protein [Abditibacterium sp.]